MKNVTKIYIPFIFGIFLMLSSCSGELNSTNREGEEEPIVSNLVEGAEELVDEPTFSNCDCSPLPGTTYEISKTCANCLKANYVANGSKFPNVLDSGGKSVPVRGFKIAYAELDSIIGDGTGTKVYTMMGINTTDRGATLEPDIFHHVITATGETRYYDFTQPCPTYCPD